MKSKRTSNGFTLIELMIVIAVIGILASIAIPQYSLYTNKAKFAQLKVSVSPIKIRITECYADNGLDISNCNTSADMPVVQSQVTTAMLNSAASSEDIASITVTPEGMGPKITVVPDVSTGLSPSDTYELIGRIETNSSGEFVIQSWIISGGGCSKSYC